MKTLLLLIICALPLFNLQAKCRGKGNGDNKISEKGACSTCDACSTEIKAEEGTLIIPVEQWKRLWMDEIVARDLYTELDSMTRKPIFQNISRSEVRHREMIEGLLTSAGVELPEAPKAGEYPDPELQDVYNTHLASGRTSEKAAFEAGEAFEKQDISELEAALQTEGISESETKLLQALIQASHRHLSAFQRQLHPR